LITLPEHQSWQSFR